MVGGLADFTAGVLAAVFQDQLDAAGDVPVKAAAKREGGRAFLRRCSWLAGFKPGLLESRTGGDVPFQIRAVKEVVADAGAEGDPVRQVLKRISVILGEGQNQIEPA